MQGERRPDRVDGVLWKYLNMEVLNRTAVDELINHHTEVGERANAGGKRRQNLKVFYRFADSTRR
ncbi:MAG: DUF4368 domain-containing protein [Oscillospiraceae bacterium]|jgi:site-specific DNA recombinase|nr:DUF4368 domain-containing protein [Oscillospiraceae bacterium]